MGTRITRIVRSRGAGASVRVELDDGSTLRLPAAVAARAGLAPGDEPSPADWEGLRAEARAHEARERALRLLAVRPRSRRELRRRLTAAGLDDPLVDATLASLERSGLLDDRAFAASFVRERIRARPRAPRALVRELRARGVEAEIARSAVAEALAEAAESEALLARRAAASWVRRASPALLRAARGGGGPEREAVRRRLGGYLQRRGFAVGVALAVVKETLEPDLADSATTD